MAQSAGALVVHSLKETASAVVYFLAIEKARFRKPVVPGDLLRMPVKKLAQRGPVWKFGGQACVGEALYAEAECSAMIRDGSAGRRCIRPRWLRTAPLLGLASRSVLSAMSARA